MAHSGKGSGDDFPNFPEGTKSLLSRTLTREMWEELKDKNDKEGFSFRMCINSGVKNLDSGVGIYCGSHDSYVSFALLLNPTIEEFHGHKPSDTHTKELAPSKLNLKFSDDEAAMIKSTRIRVARNMAGYPLGPAITKEQRLEIMNKVKAVFEKFEGNLKGTFYPLEGMSKDIQQQLIADHFLFKEGDRFMEHCGLNRDWPSGRGIFFNDEKNFLIWVNEEDQLRVISMQQGADIQEVYTRLCQALILIEGEFDFSYDDHLGFITSCPTNLGTCLRASVHIMLPNISKNMDAFQKIAEKYQLQIRGIHGEHSESTDATYDISNKKRLGRSENDLLQDMFDGIKAIMAAEMEASK